MKLVTFTEAGGDRLGALVGAAVVDLSRAAMIRGVPMAADMQSLIDGGPELWDVARKILADPPESSVIHDARLRAPLPRPLRFRDACLFLEHLQVSFEKAGLPFCEEFRQQIIYYNGDNLHVFGPDEDIPWPRDSEDRDYELEWACIIGKPGANVSAEAARDHIFGYTILNDWSARDLQMPFMKAQLGPGGGKDFANSLGPCIVTTDEIGDPYALRMTAKVNGDLWSDGSTSTMHHSFEDAVHRLSIDRPLVAGEIIGSGTVLSGCGFELGRQIAIGDLVELEIEGIGCLRNRVVAATA